MLRTIRARLIAGFGTSVGVLLLAGALGWWGLTSSNAKANDTVMSLSDRADFTERATTTILRELVAGLRYVNTRSDDDQRQYLALVDQADQLRRDAIKQGVIRPAERRRMETIGQLQAALEVRIATTHAWQVVGREADAQRVLKSTTKDVQSIETELQALRAEARSSANESMDELQHVLQRAEASLAVLIAMAFGLAAFFGLSTARAVTQPLSQLRSEMAAIGAGDLRVPDALAHSGRVAQEYADLIGAMQQARERLRILLERVRNEADHVTLAAGELSASASAAATSSQHVTTAVMDISQGASLHRI